MALTLAGVLGESHEWDLAWLVVWPDLCPRALSGPRFTGRGRRGFALLVGWPGQRAHGAGATCLEWHLHVSADAVNVLDAACFIGGRYQGGDGPSLRVERRATHRRLWAVLWCDGEHAPLVDIMGDRSRDALHRRAAAAGGRRSPRAWHHVFFSLPSPWAAAWEVSPQA